MVMYRPFLHYVSGGSQGRGIDKRSYACAAACVSVARNVVHITAEMKKKQLLNGSYWFTMYTTYFAILSLLFFILENPESATAKDGILKDALEGKNTLAGLAKRSMAADRCTQSLNVRAAPLITSSELIEDVFRLFSNIYQRGYATGVETHLCLLIESGHNRHPHTQFLLQNWPERLLHRIYPRRRKDNSRIQTL